jgi:hypothetical protein
MVKDFVLYIDDSGNKEYASTPSGYGTHNSRHFVFGSLLISIEEAGILSSKIIQLKLRAFNDETVEIKSNWLRIPYERRDRYLRKYDITEEELDGFVESYYESIVGSNLKFIAAVIDKVHMEEDYPNPWYPPAVAYDLLIQRVQMDLGADELASVIVDDMTGATPKGNQYKDNLKRQHEQLRKSGSSLRRNFPLTCLPQSLKFVNSAHSHLIQVADIASYNVHRQFRDYGDEWETKGLASLPTYHYFNLMTSKFRNDGKGRIQGYGVIKFPLRERIKWVMR